MYSFNFHKEFKHSGHECIIQFFKKNGFGTNNPVMTYLSILAPTDRCVILEELYSTNQSNSILNDKLLLAYVTSGKTHLAKKVIENSIRNGESEINVYGLQSKLNLALAPVRNRQQRVEIYQEFLANTKKRDAALEKILGTNKLLEIEFLNMLIDFCNKYYD